MLMVDFSKLHADNAAYLNTASKVFNFFPSYYSRFKTQSSENRQVSWIHKSSEFQNSQKYFIKEISIFFLGWLL